MVLTVIPEWASICLSLYNVLYFTNKWARKVQIKRKTNLKKKKLWGINIFGILLIFSSLFQMTGLGFARYKYLFDYMSAEIVLFRYFISWMLRILGIASAIGILRRKDIFRKIALGIFIFTILTVYWKHPHIGFERHTQYLDQMAIETGISELRTRSFSSLTSYAVIGARFLDALFAACFIYYFTRPKVKAQFKAHKNP